MRMLGADGARHASVFALALVLGGLASPGTKVRAANVCVLAGDGPGLQAALAAAASNDEDDVIMLQAGIYDTTNLFLKYLPGPRQHDLTVSGGFHEDPDTADPCGGIQSFDAHDTVVSGGRLWMNLPAGAGSITLTNLTSTSTFASPNQNSPVDIEGFPSSTGNLTIDRVIFEGKVSPDNNAIYLSTSGGAFTITNSIFYQNVSFAAGVNAIVIGNLRPDTSLCTEIVHSTFVENDGTSAPAVAISGSCEPYVVNSVFWGNAEGQLSVAAATGYFANDDVASPNDIANMQVTASFSLDPMLNADLSIGDMSPLRDAGVVGVFFANGNRDVTGAPRIYGNAPDIGAFELQDVIFAHPFDWQIPSP